MSIEIIYRKNKGKGYRVRIMKEGRKFSETFDRLYDAQQCERGIIEAGVFVETDLTFEQATQQWLKNHAELHKTPSGFAADFRMLKKNILPFLSMIKLRKLSVRHIEDLIHTLKKRGLSNNSIKRNLDPVKAILNHFVRRRVILFNPMSMLSPFKLDEIDIHFWSLQEAGQFLGYTEAKYKGTDRWLVYLFYKVALHTGMRLGELLGLKWSVIDFERKIIKVCRSYCGVSKAIRESTKSRKIRHVPLAEGIYKDLLEAYQNRQCELVLHMGGNVMDKSNLRNHYFSKDIRASKVSVIRIHDLRHTYASHFMMNGGNIYHLQSILGHGDIRMTQRYAHLSKNFFGEKADIVRFDGGQVLQVDFKKASDVR